MIAGPERPPRIGGRLRAPEVQAQLFHRRAASHCEEFRSASGWGERHELLIGPAFFNIVNS